MIDNIPDHEKPTINGDFPPAPKKKNKGVTPTEIFKTRVNQYLPRGWRCLALRNPNNENEIEIKLTCAWYAPSGQLTCQDIRGSVDLLGDINAQIKGIIACAKPEMKIDQNEVILIEE